MPITVYTDYEEFSYSEKEICKLVEDQNHIKDNDYYDPIDSDDIDEIFGSNDSSIDLRTDATYYIVCDLIEEELCEDIACYLGKTTKIYMESFNKVFFYVI